MDFNYTSYRKGVSVPTPAAGNVNLHVTDDNEVLLKLPGNVLLDFVRAQQVHWLQSGDALNINSVTPSIALDGLWPNMATIVGLESGMLTSLRLLGQMPKLATITVPSDALDNSAQDNLFIDAARNATEFTIENGTIDLSGNPGTPTSASQAARGELTALGWTLTYPTIAVPSGAGGSFSGGMANVYWDALPSWQSIDVEMNGSIYTTVSGVGTFSYNVGSGTTTVFRLRAKSGGVISDWTSDITVTTPE